MRSPSPEAAAAARWSGEFDADPSIVPEIRAGVTGFARADGAPSRVVTDIELAVSEAATNAVVHAFVGRQAGRVCVIAEAGEDCLMVRVIDDGRGMTPRSDSPGLGLSTMSMLASKCEISSRAPASGTEVRLRFTAPGVTGPPLGSAEDRSGRALAPRQTATSARRCSATTTPRPTSLTCPRVRAPNRRAARPPADESLVVTDCAAGLDVPVGPANLRAAERAYSPRAFRALPAWALASATGAAAVDARLYDDVVWILRRYHLRVSAAREAGHHTHGDGTAVDLLPADGSTQAIWDASAGRLAHDLG
jgi:anti-sigma regulatory factor (Ser/Thr protein kinase)